MKIQEEALGEEHVGRAVLYVPGHAGGEEEGTIKRWNDEYVFVSYRGAVKATYPRDLRWAAR